MKKQIHNTLKKEHAYKQENSWISNLNIVLAFLFTLLFLSSVAAQEKSWIKTTVTESRVSLDKQNQPWVYYQNKIRSYSSTGTMGNLVSFTGLNFSSLKFISNSEFYAAGTFTGTVSPGGKTISSMGGRDLFIGKFSTTGAVSWITAFGSIADDYSVDFNIKANDEIGLSGVYTQTLKKGNDSLLAGSHLNMYFASCNSNGVLNFNSSLHANGTESWDVYMSGFTIDAAGNYYPCIRFHGNCSIDGKAYNAAEYGTLLLKLNSSGQKSWERTIIANLTVSEIEIDHENNIYYAGYFKNTLNLASLSVQSKGEEDICLFKLDQSSNPLWLKRAGGTSYFDNPSDIFITSENEILLCGNFRETADFDSISLVSEGEADGFIVRYNKNGKAFRGSSIGSFGMDVIMEPVAIGADVYIIGYHQETMMWGSVPMAGEGLFLGKLSMPVSAPGYEKQNAMIFPNPSVGKFKVVLENNAKIEKAEILDLNGRIVWSREEPGPEIEPGLLSGIYFIKVSSSKGSTVQKIAVR